MPGRRTAPAEGRRWLFGVAAAFQLSGRTWEPWDGGVPRSRRSCVTAPPAAQPRPSRQRAPQPRRLVQPSAQSAGRLPSAKLPARGVNAARRRAARLRRALDGVTASILRVAGDVEGCPSPSTSSGWRVMRSRATGRWHRVRIHYPVPLHLQLAYAGLVRARRFPVSEHRSVYPQSPDVPGLTGEQTSVVELPRRPFAERVTDCFRRCVIH
jgi:hypothetical protein